MAEVYGRQRKPRALIQGFDKQVGEAIGNLFATHRLVATVRAVEQSEWDVLIVCGNCVPTPDRHLFVVAFGGSRVSNIHGTGASGSMQWLDNMTRSMEFVSEPKSPGMRPLLESLMERLERLEHKPELRLKPFVNSMSDDGVSRLKRQRRVFLRAGTGEILACSFTRSSAGQAICWALPIEAAADSVSWVRLALEEWRTLWPETFPRDHDWKKDPRWQTAEERRTVGALLGHKDETVTILKQREAEEEKLREALEEAKEAAEDGERRLLTEQGDELVQAVRAGLVELGFDPVEDMDAQLEKGAERFEDLRAWDEGKNWVTLIEVRGYKKGAKANDLQALHSKYVPRYVRMNGGYPSAVWYVVNDFKDEPPEERPSVLAGSTENVETFGESDPPGLVVRTTELFQLIMAVREGRLSAEDARQVLKNASRIFYFAPGEADKEPYEDTGEYAVDGEDTSGES